MYNFNPDQEVLKTLKKRRNLYSLIFLVGLVLGAACCAIPNVGMYIGLALIVISDIFAGCGLLCINYYRYEKSGGRRQGGGLWWWFLFIFGLIVVPLITVVILNHISPLAQKVLGVEFVD